MYQETTGVVLPHKNYGTKFASWWLDIPEQTMAKWRSEKTVNLPFVKAGRKVLYRGCDLLDFVERNTHTQTL